MGDDIRWSESACVDDVHSSNLFSRLETILFLVNWCIIHCSIQELIHLECHCLKMEFITNESQEEQQWLDLFHVL